MPSPLHLALKILRTRRIDGPPGGPVAEIIVETAIANDGSSDLEVSAAEFTYRLLNAAGQPALELHPTLPPPVAATLRLRPGDEVANTIRILAAGDPPEAGTKYRMVCSGRESEATAEVVFGER